MQIELKADTINYVSYTHDLTTHLHFMFVFSSVQINNHVFQKKKKSEYTAR